MTISRGVTLKKMPRAHGLCHDGTARRPVAGLRRLAGIAVTAFAVCQWEGCETVLLPRRVYCPAHKGGRWQSPPTEMLPATLEEAWALVFARLTEAMAQPCGIDKLERAARVLRAYGERPGAALDDDFADFIAD